MSLFMWWVVVMYCVISLIGLVAEPAPAGSTTFMLILIGILLCCVPRKITEKEK